MLIERANERDLAAVLRLLALNNLPIDGAAQHVGTMVVARDDGEVVGAAAVELYAGGALLRSVVVDPTVQGQRIGHRLTEAALDIAREHSVSTVYLMTTTSEGFFPKFGFEPIARADVPESVQASVEFQSACPASAAVMRKRMSPVSC